MSHKHCIFCGKEVPVPRPTSFSLVCYAENNTGPMDTSGHRYHALLLGRVRSYLPTAEEIATKAVADDIAKHGLLAGRVGLTLEQVKAAHAHADKDYAFGSALWWSVVTAQLNLVVAAPIRWHSSGCGTTFDKTVAIRGYGPAGGRQAKQKKGRRQ